MAGSLPIRQILGELDNRTPIPKKRLLSPEANNTPKGGTKAGDYMRIYFLFQYVLCFCPFRFQKLEGEELANAPDGARYKTTTWLPQRLMCVITGISAVIGIVGELRLSLPKDTSNATLYFQMAQTCAFSLGKFLILWRYWFDSEKYLKILNMMMSTELGTLGKTNFARTFFSSKWTFFAMCIIYWVNEVGYYLMGLDAGTKDQSEVKISMWQSMMIDAKFNFLFQPKETQVISDPKFDSMEDIALMIMACLSYYQRIILGAFDNMYSLGAITTLWTLTTSFVQKLEDEHHLNGRLMPDLQDIRPVSPDQKEGDCPWWPEFFERYKQLRKAADEISILFGTNIAMVMIETIVFFSTSFAGMFKQIAANANWLRSAVACTVCYTIGLCCVLSADIGRKMRRVRNWLSLPENRYQIPMHDLQCVLDDLDIFEVAMKASNKYPVTYNVLANIAGTSVTYFIICVQI